MGPTPRQPRTRDLPRWRRADPVAASESKHAPARQATRPRRAVPSELTPLRRRLTVTQMLCRRDAAGDRCARPGTHLVRPRAERRTGLPAPTAGAMRVYTGVLLRRARPSDSDRAGSRTCERPDHDRLCVVRPRASDRSDPAYRLSEAPGAGVPSLPGYLGGTPCRRRSRVTAGWSSTCCPRRTRRSCRCHRGDHGEGLGRARRVRCTAASHFNKATKGHLTRALATWCDLPRPRGADVDTFREAGFDAELDGRRLD